MIFIDLPPITYSFNIYFQVRLPPNTSDDVDEDPTGSKALWDRGLLNGASQKVEVSSTLSTPLSHMFRIDYWHEAVLTTCSSLF